MSRPANASDSRERLRTISRSLQALHRALLEYQRRDYEKSFGRIGSDFYLLQLAADDPQFAWIRVLSAEMMRIDVAISGGEVDDTDLLLVGSRLRYLLMPTIHGTPFQSRYDGAMQSSPEIIMAHAAVMRTLPPARRVTLFRSDAPVETVPVASASGVEMRVHHPGELVPGHGDHGYRALAAVVECFMEPGSSTGMSRRANEEIVYVLPSGDAAIETSSGSTYRLDSDHVVVVNAGTGVDLQDSVRSQGDRLRMLQIYVRPIAVSLEPWVQAEEVRPTSAGAWRAIVGPEDGDAPFFVRNALYASDIVLQEGEKAVLPQRDGWNTYVLVYDGDVEIDGIPFASSQSGMVVSPESVPVAAITDARIVAILIDPAAKIARAGTFAR